jgi:hypothetical protein
VHRVSGLRRCLIRHRSAIGRRRRLHHCVNGRADSDFSRLIDQRTCATEYSVCNHPAARSPRRRPAIGLNISAARMIRP